MNVIDINILLVGTLCLGNYEGQLSVVSVTNLNTEILNYEGEQTIGANVNKKKVLYITSIEYNQYCFLISVLEEFLHIFLVLEDGTIVDEMYYNTGNTTITGIHKVHKFHCIIINILPYF